MSDALANALRFGGKKMAKTVSLLLWRILSSETQIRSYDIGGPLAMLFLPNLPENEMNRDKN